MASITFKGIAARLVAAAKDFKADVLKAAEKAPVIVADVQKDRTGSRCPGRAGIPRRRGDRGDWT